MTILELRARVHKAKLALADSLYIEKKISELRESLSPLSDTYSRLSRADAYMVFTSTAAQQALDDAQDELIEFLKED